MNTIYGKDGNVYETGIREINSEPFIQSELVKNEANQIELQYNNYKNQKFNELVKKNQQLKNNWNELKKDIGYELIKLRELNEYNEGLCNAFNYINNKMQELEKESDSNE